ncbi:MAG TPA: hypothetical protein VJH96_04600 [Patescibacteria group bacterium]|nr:hypothetical protein [Patescibacteria group bacterium]
MRKSVLFISVFSLLSLILIINIYVSQLFNPLFFHLIEGKEREAAVAFLKKIAGTKHYDLQRRLFGAVYGADLQRDLDEPMSTRQQEIERLESLLAKNEKARDVLVALALLYREQKNEQKAREYYLRAKDIDPKLSLPID